MQNSSGSSTITATVPAEIIKESRIQPVWHVIVLNVLTLCFYAPIWFYKNARDLSNRLKFSLESESAIVDPSASKSSKKERKDKSENKERKQNAIKSDASDSLLTPLPQSEDSGIPGPIKAATGQPPAKMCVRDSSYDTLAPLSSREKDVLDLVKRVPPLLLIMGMALPVINFFLGIYFFKMLADLCPDTSSLARKQPLIAGVLLSLLLIGALCLFKLPKIYFLLYCPAVCIPLSIAQHWLNMYWQNVELDKELLVRHSFSTIELVMLIFGIMLLGLIIAGFYIVPFDVQP
jgi:hypothetical protein